MVEKLPENEECEITSKLKEWMMHWGLLKESEFDNLYKNSLLTDMELRLIENSYEIPVFRVVNGLNMRNRLKLFDELLAYRAYDTSEKIEFLQSERYWIDKAVRNVQDRERARLGRELEENESTYIRHKVAHNSPIKRLHKAIFYLKHNVLGYNDRDYSYREAA